MLVRDLLILVKNCKRSPRFALRQSEFGEMIMETPLDVLSRAASLVHPDESKRSDVASEGESRADSPKCIPSAENRRKRNLERREISQALSFDEARAKNFAVKTAGTQTSPLSPVPAKPRVDNGPPPLISIVPRSETGSPQSRPSVITPTNLLRQPVHFVHSPPFYDPKNMFYSPGSHRREVTETGGIDPFVEEHFRRSLGKDYKRVSPMSVSAAGSVDEHFAKALGETWNKLKETELPPSPPHAAKSTTRHLQSIASPGN